MRPPGRSRVVAVLAVLAALAALASVAWAGEPSLAGPKSPAAHEHFTRGNRLYRIRQFEGAIAEYQAGAVLELAPVFDYNLGQCYRQLGKYADAIWHYERFLKSVRPGSELYTLVTGFLQQLRGELERTAVMQPPADGARGPAPGPSGRDEPHPAARDRAPSTGPSPAIAARGEARWYADSIGWGLAGSGVIGGGVAAYLLASASGLREDADRTLEEERRLALRDAWRGRRFAGIAAGIGGVGLFTLGMVKLALHGGRPPPASAAAWGLGAGDRGAVVFCRF